MRKSTGVLAALIAVALAVSGCTSDEGKEPPCTKTPSLPACAQVGAAPSGSPLPSSSAAQYDITIRDMSMLATLQRIRKASGLTFGIMLVAPGEGVNCKRDGWKTIVDGTSSELAFYCDEGYIAVPARLGQTLATAPSATIWYSLAKQVVRADPTYRTNVARASCAAGFITAKKPDFTRALADQFLDETLWRESNETLQATTKGVNLAMNGKPINNCKTGK